MHQITNPRQIGGLLVGRRKHLKLSQGDIAARLGLKQSRVSQLEARPETLTAEQLLILMKALGLEMVVRERTPQSKSKLEW